jgi:hypothetical protein
VTTQAVSVRRYSVLKDATSRSSCLDPKQRDSNSQRERRCSDLNNATSALIISPAKQRAVIIYIVSHVKCYNWNKLLSISSKMLWKVSEFILRNLKTATHLPEGKRVHLLPDDVVKQRVYNIRTVSPWQQGPTLVQSALKIQEDFQREFTAAGRVTLNR